MDFENDDDLVIEPNEVLEQELPTSDDFEAPTPPQQDEDDKEAYSKRVQKRIDKLAYERNIERSKREELEQRLAAQEERLLALTESQQAQAEERQTNLRAREQQELMQRRKDAFEIGDYDEVNQIDEKLLDLKVKEKVQPQREQPANQPTPQREPEQTQTPTQPEAMTTWQQRNQWVFDPNQKAKLDKADAIYRDLLAKGYDPEEPELYEEVDKRIKREVPPPGNGPDRGQITGSDKSGFSAQDKRDMENWGLDPNDPNARKEWIKQKAGN